MTRTLENNGHKIEVAPTMEALGDQPWRVRVYTLDGNAFQGLMIEAGSPEEAANEAYKKCLEMYGEKWNDR